VGQLHLFARVVLFQMQVKPDERESNADRFCVLIGSLRHEGIDYVLMNKLRISARQGVTRKLVILFLFDAISVHLRMGESKRFRITSNMCEASPVGFPAAESILENRTDCVQVRIERK